jgi:hypothetical protein
MGNEAYIIDFLSGIHLSCAFLTLTMYYSKDLALQYFLDKEIEYTHYSNLGRFYLSVFVQYGTSFIIWQ